MVWSEFALKVATGKNLMWVCHWEDSWKNLTPCHSRPSIWTKMKLKYETYNIEIIYKSIPFKGVCPFDRQINLVIPSTCWVFKWSAEESFSFFLPNLITPEKKMKCNLTSNNNQSFNLPFCFFSLTQYCIENAWFPAPESKAPFATTIGFACLWMSMNLMLVLIEFLASPPKDLLASLLDPASLFLYEDDPWNPFSNRSLSEPAFDESELILEDIALRLELDSVETQ